MGGLVGDLALGIVDTILTPGEKGVSQVGKKKFTKKVRSTPNKKRRLGPETESSEQLLAKALDKAREAGINKKSLSAIDKLAGDIIENMGKQDSGSSRTSSGLSHDGSDVDILTYKLISQLPKNVEISPRSTSGSEILASKLVPKEYVSMAESSPRSEVENFTENIVEKSVQYGAEGAECVSAASSLAEFAISKSFVEGNYSKTTSESNMIEQLINNAALDAIEIPSTKSSLASQVVRKSMVVGEQIALSKSPVSSIAEDIVKNIQEMKNSDESTADELADDILQHVLTDMPSNLNVKDNNNK